MDGDDSPSAAICKRCGEPYKLPDDKDDDNLPRVLLCGHIFCTFCLQSIEYDGVIRCPECEGDSRIIGLIYTTKMNKMKSLRFERSNNRRKNKLSTAPDIDASTGDKQQPPDIVKIEKAVDEALARAAENLAQLEHINETLMTGLAEQMKRERARLEMEIKQAADKALHAIQKWKDVQLSQLTKLEATFSTSQALVSAVQERIKALETAMQMAREVRRVPFLEQYCTLDKVLETLNAPVDNQSFDLQCITMGSGMSCIFQSESVNRSLAMSLKMEVSSPKRLSESPPKGFQQSSSNRKSLWNREGRDSSCVSLSHTKRLSPLKQWQEIPMATSPSSRVSSLSPRAHCRLNLCLRKSASNLKDPDVVIEAFFEEGQEHAHPPTGPELASDKWRIQRRRSNPSGNDRNVNHWVVVTHVVNPGHFYVRYLTERRESRMLTKKINQLCYEDSCHFTARDTVETGSMIFGKWKEGHWYRASVVEVSQKGCVEAVKACPVTQLASMRIFLLDSGITKTIPIQRENESTESALKAVNSHLRKVDEAGNVALGHFAPQAIRCSLMDLVPYDLRTGWSTEAQTEFCRVVGSAAVEMRPLGQDRDSLLVDLRKAPMDQSSDVPISVREYLVLIEVARFYSPVTPSRRPLTYYPPVYPRINSELSAVVSYIINPADFYIQLVDNMESLLLLAKLQECYNATKVSEEDELHIYCPVIGQACVARFDDKLWYRAQVKGHPAGRKVEVQYVDFGNQKIVSVSDLRKIKDEFFALPAMAIHCCLSDVIPVDGQSWSDACINRFISLAHQKLITIMATGMVPRTEPLPVKLLEGDLNGPLANIAELLVKEELACFKERLKSNSASPSDDDHATWETACHPRSTTEQVEAPDQTIPGEQNEEPLVLQPLLNLPARIRDMKVRVSHVNSPSSFYVQLTQYDSHLTRICELVEEECSLMGPQDVEWQADMYCAAHIKGVWERGQICSDFTSSSTAEVRRCDHGNTVKLQVSNVRPLPSSLIGSLTLECTLKDIRPAGGRSTWTVTACDLFTHYLTTATTLTIIKEETDERPAPVTLFHSTNTGQSINIADFLVREGLALRGKKTRVAVVQQPNETDKQSPVSERQTDGEKENSPPSFPLIPFTSTSSLVSSPGPPKPMPRSIMTAEKVKTSLYRPPELPSLGHIQIHVSAIGADGLIYARTQNAEYQLEQLRERIQQSMKTLPRQKLYTWKSVLGCAVIGSDMSWCRGELLEVLGGNIMVRYVDHGLVENIPVVHAYPILLCDDVPQLCIPCQLRGINPVGDKWQQDAEALLREMLLNRSVDMQVLELPANPRGALTVEIYLAGLSLSRILCHHQHATVDRTVSEQKGLPETCPAPPLDDWDINTEGLSGPEEPMLGSFVDPNLPQEGEHFQVRVKHLCTPNELFLWPLEGHADVEIDGETLDEALTRFNANICAAPPLTSFPRGGPCLAEYSDGKYYRAKLMKFTSVEPVVVLIQHVDFGSDDTLPTSKLRQMPAELLQFPTQALKVKVGGFKAPSINRQEEVLPYSPGWSVKATMDMIKLLHGNITALIVADEPELTVLLYNVDGELVHLPLVLGGLAELE
ncbi:RING finger protein 17 [Brachyistius frenatus]|uniref:RING finger protein 17 n=1 Tax=Brachyistius frenatus TaxID=100188 RepID=UPI0037E9503F